MRSCRSANRDAKSQVNVKRRVLSAASARSRTRSKGESRTIRLPILTLCAALGDRPNAREAVQRMLSAQIVRSITRRASASVLVPEAAEHLHEGRDADGAGTEWEPC